MKKNDKIKRATKKLNKSNIKKKTINFFSRIYNFCLKYLKLIWNWIKRIDIIGLINLLLLVAIISLFTSLILDLSGCHTKKAYNNNVASVNKNVIYSTVKVPALPLNVDKKTNIKPQIKTINVQEPVILKEVSVPATKVQHMYGDIIVDTIKSTTVLHNGIDIEGNLFVQNMRKYTLPCGLKIKGNLFIRNVRTLYFCGDFTVEGNVYVNRYSSFGPIPKTAHIGGQVIL